MNFGRQVTFWVAALAVLVVLLWLLSGILLPFVAGMALAYVLNPVVGRLQALGLGRLVAIFVVISFFVLAFIFLLLLIAPILGSQLASFIENIPSYVQRLQALLTDPNKRWLNRLVGESLGGSNQAVGDLISQGVSWITAFLKSLWSGGRALVSLFSLMVVTPVVAFYLIYDWDRMLNAVDSWVPRPHQEIVRQLAREIDTVIAGFVRGQSAVCVILGAFYAVALTLVGLNFGLLIGLISGLISFIPYIGTMTGLVLSVGVAVAQFWPHWSWILVVLGIFLFGQFVEGNILSPKLVGESVGLHPVWVMFALFAFGYLFGFVGLLLAVPMAAAVGVLARFALKQYLASPFYHDTEPQ